MDIFFNILGVVFLWLAVEYCLAHPQWRLSLQTHKYLGIA